MKKFRFSFLCLVLSLSVAMIVVPLSACAGHEFERQVFELTNIERAHYGLTPLIWDAALARVARDHAIDMRDNNMRGHIGSDGSTVRERVERAGIAARGWSENMAYGQQTPQAVVAAWMNSPGHRANILRAESTHLGVGFIEGNANSDFSIYWAQKFIIVS